ncbi:MAG TPA: DUF4159 domain-containing protein [Thermodesulfobacteriota bacterium]|nr:DUF4159 domain-containing protein [Thermodesulfobacteriota bacterium]
MRGGVSRRELLVAALGAAAALTGRAGRSPAQEPPWPGPFLPGGPGRRRPGAPGGGAGFAEGGTSGRVVLGQLRYRGDWDPHPRAIPPLMEEIERRTSVETAPQRRELALTDRELFAHPFLYMAGRRRFEPFTAAEVETLRRYLAYGGLLLVDDATGVADSEFARAVREQLARVFPGRGLARLPDDHTVFRTFYLIRSVVGRTAASPYLEGITLDDWTPVLFCANDLGGAWERDYLGNPTYPCVPGGEAQRREAYKLGVNIALYAVTANYKKDQIHIPFIRERMS